MADLISPTINLIRACVNRYTDFCAFKEECETFRRSLANVADVLEDVERELSKGSSGRSSSATTTGSGGDGAGSLGGGRATNTKLRRPMELLQTATAEGGLVLQKCCAKRKLLAFVFSRQLLGMLNKAKADIEEAMRLLQLSSVTIQVSTRRMMDTVTERLDELHSQILLAGTSSPNEVAELVRAEMKLHRESHGETLAEALSEALVKMGVVSSPQDCAEQFAELRREADSIRQAKVIYDEEMLEAVKALTAPRDEDDSQRQGQRQGSEATASAVEQCIVCPISGEIMHDPVTVMESGLTYDRKFLCTSLLLYPDLEPATGQRFDHPLHYTPNMAVRNLITAQHGDSYYQKYDDGHFKDQYQAKWTERRSATPSVVVIKEDSESGANEGGGDSGWTSFDSWTAFTEPTSATSGESRTAHEGVELPLGTFERSNNHSQSPDVAHVQVNVLSSDASVGEEAVELCATTKEGDDAPRCWRTRRRRKMLIAGVALLVVVTVVTGAVVGTSKSSPDQERGDTPTTSTLSTMERFNLSLPPSTIASLQNKLTPQYRAYDWVTNLDQVPRIEESFDDEAQLFRMVQRFALATLFYSIEGLGSWVESTVSECRWGNSVGAIECERNSHVVAVVVNETSGGNGGTLPPEVGLLSDLARLDINSLALSSSIPTELGQLSALTGLDLGTNALTSSIPTELGNITTLTGLGLSGNNLTSSIPTELGQLITLEVLILSANALTSTIPTEMRRLPALTLLNLNGNQLSSTIPTELGMLTALTDLSLSSNALTSSIPTELGRLTTLKKLALHQNNLSSSIPTELGQLVALTDLILESNRLPSAIPTELGRLTALTSLALGSNALVSTIPTELGRLLALQYLDLANNALTSTIPTELGQLDNIVGLGLLANRLTGSFPTSLCYVGPRQEGRGIYIDCSEVACSCCGC